MEILGSSRDLQSLTNWMPLDVATQLTQEYFSTKIVRPSLTGSRESPAYTATFKQDKGSHLLLLSLLRFKPHIKGDKIWVKSLDLCGFWQKEVVHPKTLTIN